MIKLVVMNTIYILTLNLIISVDCAPKHLDINHNRSEILINNVNMLKYSLPN